MKIATIVIGFCFVLNISFGQGLIDSLDLWAFDWDMYSQVEKEKPIGEVMFWRTTPIDDGFSKKIYGKFWTPHISYEIFNLSDSTYCKDQSLDTKIYSSCVAPDVGGDVFIIGRFIFLNRVVCLECGHYKTKVDFCRPQINRIVDMVDKRKTSSLNEIFGQFRIKKGKWSNASR